MKAMTTSSSRTPTQPRRPSRTASWLALTPPGSMTPEAFDRFLDELARRAVSRRGQAGSGPQHWRDLPFTERTEEHPLNAGGAQLVDALNFWAVEPTTDREQAERTGKEYALAFLRLLETDLGRESTHLTLQWIVLAMLDEARAREPFLGDQTDGYAVGFFDHLAAVLKVGAQHCDPFVVAGAASCEPIELELASVRSRILAKR